MSTELGHISRYELRSLQGRGGMGTVYKAWDPAMERWVAVKTITVQDAHQRARFKQEVKAAGSLNHPHITTIYDVGETGELAYIVMELVEGETLSRRLSSPVLWPEAVKLLVPICQALAYAHSRGVIHRDVKPANILVSTEGQVKLTDFGVARLEAALRRITESGSTVGTPLYTAPEQIRNEPVDGRADIFSVGIVLFELITGQHPFTGDTLAQVVYQLTQPEPVNLAPITALVPPALVEVVGRTLNKDPAARFTDANELGRILATFLESSSVTPGSISSSQISLASSPHQPIIDPVSNISLSPTEETLLSTIFAGHDRVYLEREFSSGYSGARVLLATPVRSGGRRLAQVVLKFDTPAEIDREWQAYQKYVKDTLPPVTARILEKPLYAPDGQLALLRYTFAGGFGNAPPEALRTYYAQHRGEEVAALLEKGVFRAFGAKWWLQRKTTDLILRREYDRLLPVHLVLESRDFSEMTATPRNLVAGKTRAEFCRQLELGQLIQVQGFSVEEIQPDRNEITLQSSASSGSYTNPIRVRLTGVTPGLARYRVRQVATSVFGVVTATRQEILHQLAETAFSDQNLDGKLITIGGHPYPNPLYDYEGLLDKRLSVMYSIIHGDLNLENILVTPTSGLVWLIDFATTRESHNLYDFMRLEVQVITKLLPQIKAGPEAVAHLMAVLHQPVSSAKQIPADLQKPFAVLVAIRRMVRICMYSRDNWDEYYLGLVITLLGTLKFQELDESARRLALAAAATIRGLIADPTLQLTPPPEPALASDPPPSPSRSKLLIGVVGVITLVALLTAMGLWAWDGSTAVSDIPPPSPTDLPVAAALPTFTQPPAVTPTDSPVPPASPPPATRGEGVTVESLDIYSGPGPDYATLNIIPAGNGVQVIGRSADNQWWQIAYPSGPDGYGWIRAEKIRLIETVVPPVASAPPPEIESPSVTLTPTSCRPPAFFKPLPEQFPQLGCPTEAWSSDFTFQEFERGLMIWRKSPSPAQIFILADTGSWRSQVDPQGPPQPSCPESEQIEGPKPIFSFGLIWCTEEKDRLGEPLTGEVAAEDSPVERFERGLAFEIDQTSYLLFDTGQWEIFSTSFSGTTARKAEPTLEEGFNEPEPSLVTPGTILEDFESYDMSSIRQTYDINKAWSENELTLKLTTQADNADQGQAVVLSYKITAAPPDNYVGFEQNLPTPQNWSGVQAIQFWVRNDAAAKTLIFQWGEATTTGDGEVWKTDLLLQPDESRRFEVPLTTESFSRAVWSSAGNEQMDLRSVNYYGFFLHPTQDSEGTVYLDSIILLPGNVSDGPQPEPEPEPVSCQTEPAPQFQSLWQTYSAQLGCPAGFLKVIPFMVEENFEGGHLVWREDTDDGYVILDRLKDGTQLSEGEWQLPPWKWDGASTCYQTQTPPPGLRHPERGFGWLWCTHLGGPNGPLGWALDKEQGYEDTGLVQQFEQGFAFKGAGPKVYALLNNGHFLSINPTAAQSQSSSNSSNHQPTGFEPATVFKGLWEQLDGGRGPLGYPLGAAITNRNYARQPFERGFMFWWDSPQQPQPIWVIYTPEPLATQGNTWLRHDNLWQTGQPEYPPDCPEAGPPLGPKSGFGLAWCYRAGVKEQVGSPLEPEFGSGNVFPQGAVQFFQGGVMFENPADRQVWALIEDNGWYRLNY